MPRILPVHRDVDGRAGQVAVVPHGARLVHQLPVAGAHLSSVDRGLHAPAGDLLHAGDAGFVGLLPVGGPQRKGDRVA